MTQCDAAFVLIAAILQLAAMVFAVRMIREVNHRGPWIVLFLALFIMFGFRVMGLLHSAGTLWTSGRRRAPVSSTVNQLLYGRPSQNVIQQSFTRFSFRAAADYALPHASPL